MQYVWQPLGSTFRLMGTLARCRPLKAVVELSKQDNPHVRREIGIYLPLVLCQLPFRPGV